MPGNRSFTIPINGYDSDWDWSQTHASVGTATVDASGETKVVRVTGLDPLQASHVTVIATRVGWLDASVEGDGAADIGGQLDPTFIDKTRPLTASPPRSTTTTVTSIGLQPRHQVALK